MNQTIDIAPANVRTKGEAKQYLAEVYTIISDGQTTLRETFDCIKGINDAQVLAEYIGFIEDGLSVLKSRWKETISLEDDRVRFRFPGNIRTADGSTTVFGKGQLLTTMLNIIDRFGEEFGLELGLRKELNATKIYQLFHKGR